MRKFSFLALCASSLIATTALAQDKKQVKSDSYVRSSLYTIIVDDHGLSDDGNNSQIIKETFFSTPLPEKFNDHNLPNALREVDFDKYPVTQEEADALLGSESAPKKSAKFGKMLGKMAKETAGDLTMGVVDTTDTSKISAQFLKFFNQNKVPNLMVAKWFNYSEQNKDSGSYFNLDLISDRGLYNASELDKQLAQDNIRGIAALQDAGVNLIPNTFVVGIRLNYLDKAEMSGKLMGDQNTLLKDVAKGYIIKATAYLYQLEWNPETEETFYAEYYNAKDSSEFLNSDLFKLKFIGSQTAWADVHSTSFSKVTQEELVQRATVRSIDNVISKLQRKYDEFRTKAPLVSTTPQATAYIGTKEGVEPGDKYEVLEKMQDPTTGISSYKRVGVIRAEKGKIWDNSYGADQEKEANDTDLQATHFTGANNSMAPGMLIRQIN